MKKISCIIPAYNEAERIASIITVALEHPLIDEVIVVDDGSSDRTPQIISTFKGARIILLPKNLGKSAAVQAGIAASSGEYIFLLDADLQDISATDISELIYPIIDGVADVTMSLRKWTAPICYILGIDYTTGERIFPRQILDDLSLEKLGKLPRFGLEVFLNNLVIEQAFRLRIVRWNNAYSTLKWIKR